MSIYTNPIYGNPTTVSYTKLKDETQTFDLILSDPDKQKKYRRQHRFVSAVSCVLCGFAILFTVSAGMLAIYGVFGKCFYAKDLEAQGFEKFYKMTQGDDEFFNEKDQLKWPYQRRVKPFPDRVDMMPGPVIPSDSDKNIESIQHAQCPAMNLIECNKDSHDGFSLKEHQKRVDLLLAKAVLNGRLNTSYAVNNVRHTFKLCVKEYDGEKQSTIRNFANDVMKIKEFGSETDDSATTIANIISHTRIHFGVDILFQLEVGANYLSPDGDRPYIMYLDQKLPTSPNVGNLAMMRQAFQSLDEHEFQLMHLNVGRIREMAADSDDSNSWKSFTSAEARARWPFFDFATYLSQLNQKQQFAKNVKEFIFVVKTPTYFDKINSLFVPQTKNDIKEKINLFKTLSLYTIFTDYDKYFGIDDIENQIQKKYQLGNPSTYSHPYHFIYTFDDGHASFEALRFCTKELREYLPHIASALHADIISDFPIQEEIQRFEELIEIVREELIEWTQESNIDQKLKDVLVEKLRKIGVTFTTRESLEKESFEEAHQDLQLTTFNKYFDSLGKIRNFLFYRKLDRLNSKTEALRSSAFAESSAATIEIEYSRLGNYLNVPASSLTSPLASNIDKPQTMVYSNLGWILAREMSKAIDSEGVLYNLLGVHKRGESDLTQLEQLWTDTQMCLKQNIHNTALDGTSEAIIVRKSINEIVGFQISLRTFEKAVDKFVGKKNSHRSRTSRRNSAFKDFFRTTSSVYCSTEQRGASIALLDKAVDSYIKKNSILYCNKKFINFQCNIQLTKQ